MRVCGATVLLLEPELHPLSHFWSVVISALLVLTVSFRVFSTASLALGTELQSTAFKVIAAFLAVQVVLHWIFVSVGTLWTFRDGTLFSSQKFETEDAPHIGQRWHREDWPKTHTSDIEARPGKQATEVACEIP